MDMETEPARMTAAEASALIQVAQNVVRGTGAVVPDSDRGRATRR